MSNQNTDAQALASVAPKAHASYKDLACRARDQLHDVKTTQRAFEALERLISPVMTQDCDALEVGRSDLGELLRILNAGMREQIQKALALSDAVAEGASVQVPHGIASSSNH